MSARRQVWEITAGEFAGCVAMKGPDGSVKLVRTLSVPEVVALVTHGGIIPRRPDALQDSRSDLLGWKIAGRKTVEEFAAVADQLRTVIVEGPDLRLVR